MPSHHLPDIVTSLVEAFFAATDRSLPSVVEAFYLVGSVALNDFRPHRSDIDFVAVLNERPDNAVIAVLQRIHTELQRRWGRPFFDGIYVTWDDLATDPRTLMCCPSAHEGRVEPAGAGDMIAWHTLAQQGLACRGPAADQIAVWTDAGALVDWTRSNFDLYWQQRVLDRGAHLWTPYGVVGLTEWSCEWSVTGVSRLHYTLATGRITSKDGAGVYAQATFSARWQRVIAEALRIRRRTNARSLYRSPLARRRDVRAFAALVIADGQHRFTGR